ncbi:MAG: serpin family protein [Eubacteriales bacterium]|jgi:serine protease inhibitor
MKRFLSAVLCVLLLLAGVHAGDTYAIGKLDVPYANDQAAALKELGLMRGTDKGMELDRPVTRAQAVTMLVRFLGKEQEALAARYITGRATGLDDVDSHWSVMYVAYAYRNGITQGTSETTFSPDAYVTGPQLAKLMLSAFGYTDITLENAYTKGVAAGLLMNNYVKAAANEKTRALLRSDLAYFFHAALMAKNAEGTVIYQTLIDAGVFTKETFTKVMLAGEPTVDVNKGSFGERLLTALSDGENVTISPVSVEMALAMAVNGAAGDTRTEMLRVLGIDNLSMYNENTKKFLTRPDMSEDTQLSIANAIYLNTDTAQAAGVDVGFKKAFQTLIETYYNGKYGTVTNADAVKTINGWVEDETNGKIKNLIDSPDFLAVLVNAVYFKGEWAVKFSLEDTSKGSFRNLDGSQSQTDLMHMTKFLDYCEKDGCQILRLPYTDGRTAMYIALGDNAGELADCAGKFEQTRVAVTLPKFTVEYSAMLKDTLSAMGMPKAFTNAAEFDMFTGTGVRISQVVHKTYVAVTEAGTEAAAATSVNVSVTSVFDDEPVEFTADRPFNWCIIDETSGTVLFRGVVNKL